MREGRVRHGKERGGQATFGTHSSQVPRSRKSGMCWRNRKDEERSGPQKGGEEGGLVGGEKVTYMKESVPKGWGKVLRRTG